MDIITKAPSFFQNEHKLPLNHLSITVPTIKRLKKVNPNKDLSIIRDNLEDNYETKPVRIPALDPYWIQKSRSYHSYQPYYMEVSSEDNACFLEQNRLFLQNIQFLLNCSYQQFWCYILYEERVKVILNSFVMNAVPWYELNHLNNEHRKLYHEVYDCVARVYCRILNDKESEIEYMTDGHKSNLIHKNKIITFPLLTQLVLLYEKTNPKLIQQLLKTCENFKDKFQKEIEKMVEHVKTVYDVIHNQFSMHRSNLRFCTTFITPRPAIFDPNWFDEVVLYILDTAATLNAFLRNSKVALKAALNEQLSVQTTRFYNEIFPLIYQAFEDQGDMPEKWFAIKERIFENIAMARMEFVHLFHQFVAYYLDKIQSNRREFDGDSFEHYLSLITNILEEDFFIFDYHNSFRIDKQFETIMSNHPNVDHTRLNYFKQCLCNLPELGELLDKYMCNFQESTVGEKIVTPQLENHAEFSQKTTEKPMINEEELEKRIMEVVDTLPHLGDAYVLECLQYYNYSTAAVISAILDDTIPHEIITNPPHAIRVPPEMPEPKQQPILAYKGKKPTYKDAKDMLDDKKEMSKVRDIILKASNSAYDPYDDEYDDRDEDGSAAGIAAYNKRMREVMVEDNSDPYKYMENRFGGAEIVTDPSSSDEGEEVETKQAGRGGYRGVSRRGGGPKGEVDERAASGSGARNTRGPYRKPDFCENPELIRERWAANRCGGRGGGPSHDVVGRPRGDGQDSKVLHNRDKKNTNKSSRANHNRKRGADFKRGRGMLP